MRAEAKAAGSDPPFFGFGKQKGGKRRPFSGGADPGGGPFFRDQKRKRRAVSGAAEKTDGEARLCG